MSELVTGLPPTDPFVSIPRRHVTHSADRPEKGTLVVYALALDILEARNSNPKVKKALSRLKPKKYLGIVGQTYPTGMGVLSLVILPVAMCPPMKGRGWEFPETETKYFDQLYGSHYVKLGSCRAFNPSDKPQISCIPPLPWHNCLVWTTVGPFEEVGRYWKSNSPCKLSTEDYHKLDMRSRDDDQNMRDFLDALRESEDIEDEGSGKTEEPEEEYFEDPCLAYDTLEEEQTSQYGPLPNHDLVLEVSEDLSELSHIIYPGDFQAECRQVEQLIDLAYRGLPYEKTLYDWAKTEGNDILPGVIDGGDRIEEIVEESGQPLIEELHQEPFPQTGAIPACTEDSLSLSSVENPEFPLLKDSHIEEDEVLPPAEPVTEDDICSPVHSVEPFDKDATLPESQSAAASLVSSPRARTDSESHQDVHVASATEPNGEAQGARSKPPKGWSRPITQLMEKISITRARCFAVLNVGKQRATRLLRSMACIPT